MATVMAIDLREKFPERASIRLLRAELPESDERTSRRTRFTLALIRCALGSEEMPYGFRLDLDKRVFLDHFDEDREKERVMGEWAQAVAMYVSEKLRTKSKPATGS
jgi:hypothetical protein